MDCRCWREVLIPQKTHGVPTGQSSCCRVTAPLTKPFHLRQACNSPTTHTLNQVCGFVYPTAKAVVQAQTPPDANIHPTKSGFASCCGGGQFNLAGTAGATLGRCRGINGRIPARLLPSNSVDGRMASAAVFSQTRPCPMQVRSPYPAQAIVVQARNSMDVLWPRNDGTDLFPIRHQIVRKPKYFACILGGDD